MTLSIGVLGLGSVFSGPYAALITKLEQEGRVRLAAGYDPDPDKRTVAADRFGIDTTAGGPEDLIGRDDLDIVLVLTSMNQHGSLARAALEAGKHVLVEKPMSTSLEDARVLLEAAAVAPGQLVCAPHIVLSPTYREMHRRVRDGEIGDLHLARARYGWSGPWWGRWFYEAGGGALFDLGVYNLTSLCGFFGPVRRVTAMVGTAIPKREINGEFVTVRADDNAQITLDFGNARFATITTGFTMQQYRSPAIELYGATGVLQLLGDDWAPNGFEQWSNERGSWEVFGERDPNWPWTDGLRHLVESVENGTPTVTRPDHAFHALEVMLAAKRSAEEGSVIDVTSPFPDLDYDTPTRTAGDAHANHDPRSS
ncbi:Gfo/Idh/MocA family oxidoreductase [Kribbella capetownensis]|uniref:Gfo/Idh/MocA family oxidoreductase n=1 Tax=Kribbella capetownensis TaxID=1572659 RepID=A0A4R0JST5_9ACTN|nr:Gfo/Idh/MocA family oxidoreductase [Kribbella capetownensis]TCC49630.1 Gfo/Idh/MocA family oxidoreductase [Kribbella capetownensis]